MNDGMTIEVTRYGDAVSVEVRRRDRGIIHSVRLEQGDTTALSLVTALILRELERFTGSVRDA